MNKDKVAILTTHRANNFGAVLQAYSLVKAVCEMGAEGYVLDWRNPFFEWNYHTAWRRRRSPIGALAHLAFYAFCERAVRAKFEAFRGLMPKTATVWHAEDLSKAVDVFKSVIVGSDQVWNPAISAECPQNFDRAFLLGFVPEAAGKFAYASSLGQSGIAPEDLVPEFKKAWESFRIITMREKQGAQYLSRIAQREVACVLDPVFLHDAEYWANLEVPIELEGPFVFDYNLNSNPVLKAALLDYAQRNKIRIVRPLIPAQTRYPDAHTYHLGPREFVWAIHHAECVFTTSFHATVFSLIFNKRLVLPEESGRGGSDARFTVLDEFAGQAPAIHGRGIREYDLSRLNEQAFRARLNESRAWLGKMI